MQAEVIPLSYGYREPSMSLNDYQTALHGAVLYDSSAAGRIWMRDQDRASLLHRLSTNAIEHLPVGSGTRTVLTNHNGRIIDVLLVYALPDALLLLTSPQQQEPVLRLLKKNIFFNDKVQVAAATPDLHQMTLYGAQGAALLANLGADAATLGKLPLHHIHSTALAGVPVHIAVTLPLAGTGYHLLVAPEQAAALQAALHTAGATDLSAASYELLRVEAGYPRFPNELSLEYIPLETGLWDAISFSKGCYVGQEIIARMESRNRIAKLLRGIRFAPDAELPPLPHHLSVAGKEAGDLTSMVQSPRYGQIGLAYVRAAHAEPGTVVGVQDSDVSGTVVMLPFGDASDAA